MHIIFNSEFKNSGSDIFFDSLLKQIQNDCVEIATLQEFKTLVNNLAEDVTIKIWVHLGAYEIAENKLPRIAVKYLSLIHI